MTRFLRFNSGCVRPLVRRFFATCLPGLLILCSAQPGYALPQFTLTTGNRCVNCHVAPQGGGLRDELGRYTMEDVGLIVPDRNPLTAPNAFLDGDLLIGADARLQVARSHQSPDADRRIFPMQAALYSTYRISESLQLEGSYNFGPKKYDGQQSWTASVQIQPAFAYPQLRIGYFQPSIGMRYDDHTMLVRQVADVIGAAPLIAPNYAEYGAELHYYRLRWLSLTAGVHSARSLAENMVIAPSGQQVSLIENSDRPSLLGRIVFWPGKSDGRLSLYLGTSILVNGDFSLVNFFGGAGLRDRLSVMAEYVISDKEDMRKTRNLTVDLACQALDALILNVRGEQAESTVSRSGASGADLRTRQVVLGAQIFLLPHVELRPEYRLMDTETFRSTRYALQLHLFY